MKSKLIMIAALILVAFLAAYGAGTTVNGTRVINGDLTIKGTCTGCGGGSPSITDTYANIVATTCNGSNSGQLALATEYPQVARCNGSAWKWFYHEQPVTALPACASLTMVNQGGQTTNTCTDYGGALTMKTSGNAACCQNWFAVQAAPGSTPYSLHTKMVFNTLNTGNINAGIIFRDSVGGGSTALEFYNNTVRVEYWSAPTTDGGTLASFPAPLGFAYDFKIIDNGTNRLYCVSKDEGLSYLQIYSEGRTTNFTANRVGFLSLGWSSLPNQITFWDWTQGTDSSC